MRKPVQTFGTTPPDQKRFSDEEYQRVFSQAVRLCIDFIIYGDGGVLLAQRTVEPDLGLWALPGGMIFHGETFSEAANRISMREMGLLVYSMDLVGKMEFLQEGGSWRHSVSLGHKTRLESWRIMASDQAEKYALFDFPELISATDVQPVHREFLVQNWSKINYY